MTDRFHLLSTVGTYDISTIAPDGGLVRNYETCIFTEVGLSESRVVGTYSTEAEAAAAHDAIVTAVRFVTGEEVL